MHRARLVILKHPIEAIGFSLVPLSIDPFRSSLLSNTVLCCSHAGNRRALLASIYRKNNLKLDDPPIAGIDRYTREYVERALVHQRK